jgi:hypothetical protein
MPDTWCIYHIKNCPYAGEDKFVVIVCKDPKYRGFFINTDELRPFIQKHPERLESQIKIKASDYKFLTHDSWINCYELYEFEDKYLEDRRVVVNIITKAKIRKVVKESEVIEARHRKLILHDD